MIPHSSSSFLFTDAPRVELALGASISPESIYEGGDVYFDCRIDAQPPPRRIAWKFNVRAQFLFFLKKNKKQLLGNSRLFGLPCILLRNCSWCPWDHFSPFPSSLLRAPPSRF